MKYMELGRRNPNEPVHQWQLARNTSYVTAVAQRQRRRLAYDWIW